MNKKQTAVEWMVSQLPPIQQEGLRDIIEEANAMFERQIIDAREHGIDDCYVDNQGEIKSLSSSDQYFTETYGTK